jgi:hypothetical protein
MRPRAGHATPLSVVPVMALETGVAAASRSDARRAAGLR